MQEENSNILVFILLHVFICLLKIKLQSKFIKCGNTEGVTLILTIFSNLNYGITNTKGQKYKFDVHKI